MNAAAPALASVIVASIADFARRPVREQAAIKARLEDLVVAALQPVPPAQRIMLDAPQGVALAILDDAVLALDLADRVQSAAGDLPLCIGLNHGPITLLDDPGRGGGLVGDGLATGIVMSQLAEPGRVIASRAFHDALRADAPAKAARLASTGKHTDAQVRTHELFTLDHRAARARRRRLAVVGAAAFAGMAALGVAARLVLRAAAAPAVIELQISPRGDVYVDGVLKGQSPPLARIEVAPGPHAIEIRSGRHAPLKLEINPRPGEVTTIAHDFATGGGKSLGENVREGWRSLRRGLGF